MKKVFKRPLVWILPGVFCCLGWANPEASAPLSPGTSTPRLTSFLKDFVKKSLKEQSEWLEMGLNSDNGQIFLFVLEEILKRDQLESLPLLEKALVPGTLPEERRELVYSHYTRLRYQNLQTQEEKAQYLLKLLSSRDILNHPNLLAWGVGEFGNVGQSEGLDFFHRFDDLTWLRSAIRKLRLKLALNARHEDPAEAGIHAAQHPDPEIRRWALGRLIEMNSRLVARFLLRWTEQHNLVGGRYEFERFQKALEEHRSRFPALYVPDQLEKQ